MNLPAALTPPAARIEDLLTADAPFQPLDAPRRFNPGLRLLGFTAVAFVAGTVLGLPLVLSEQLRSVSWLVSVLQLVATVVAYLVLVLVIERRRPPIELAPNRLSGLLWGLALGAVLFLVCFGVIAVLGGYRFDGFHSDVDWGEKLFALGIVAGISEELIFRGVLFRLIEELIGTWFAAVVSGGIFGFLHLTNQDATITGALAIAIEAGIMFAFLYALTRSLWLCIGVHAAWNVVQGPILGVPVSGSGASHGWLNTIAVGPEWLTGGAFGAEASLVTVVLLVAFTIWLGLLLQQSGQVVENRWGRRTELRDRLRTGPRR